MAVVGGGKNLASKYSKVVDERFTRESQAMMALSNNYDFTGVKTVNVYSIPVVPMTDYTRSGLNRYGVPDDLQRNVQALTITKDRAFTFIIDKGDKLQSEMVMDAGKALQRNLREIWVPEFDSYVFNTLATAAIANEHYDTTAATTQNAYSLFLKGMESLGNCNVPDQGRVAFCSYGFANLLKQDSAFMRYGDASQQMLIKGVIGEVDGCKIVKVPSSRLPAGAACIITHPIAAVGPKQLEEYKIHDNPPGISGFLVEGRFIYDCFVLNEKADAIWYIGGQTVLKKLDAITTPGAAGKTQVIVPGALNGAKRAYKLYADAAAAANDALTPSSTITIGTSAGNWTEMKTDANNPQDSINLANAVTAGNNKIVRVVDVDASSHPVALGSALVNVG